MKKFILTILIATSLGIFSASAQNSTTATAETKSADAKAAAKASLPGANATDAEILKAITELAKLNPLFAAEIAIVSIEVFGNRIPAADIIGAAKNGVNAAAVGNTNATGQITETSKTVVLQNLDSSIFTNGTPSILTNPISPLAGLTTSILSTIVFQKPTTNTNPTAPNQGL